MNIQYRSSYQVVDRDESGMSDEAFESTAKLAKSPLASPQRIGVPCGSEHGRKVGG
jgi:hypothetical protein